MSDSIKYNKSGICMPPLEIRSKNYFKFTIRIG